MKNATDLLQEILDKVITIDQRLSTIELLVKRSVAKPIEETIDKKIVEDKRPLTQFKEINMPGIKPGVRLPVSVDFEFPKVDVARQEVDGRPGETASRAAAVSQRIRYEDGKNVVLAKVLIYKDGELIKETRTNAAGKWREELDAGIYNIKVIKPSGIKSGVSADFTINVNDKKDLEEVIIKG
jgi:hypothetical protein